MSLKTAFFCITLFFSITGLAQPVVTEQLYPEKKSDIKQNERFEIGISFDKTTGINRQIENFLNQEKENSLNPFLEWELKVFARFTYKGNTFIDSNFTWDQDAFYYEPYNSYQRSFTPKSSSGYNDTEYKYLGGYNKLEDNQHNFRVRWSPPKQGNYSYQIIVQIKGSERVFKSTPVDFYVVQNYNPRVTVSKNNSNFQRGDELFKPIGTNVKWPNTMINENPDFSAKLKIDEAYRPTQAPPQTYDAWKTRLNSLGEYGANYIRWINHASSFEIEYERLGDYSNRLNVAQEIDSSIWLAEQNGLFIHWTLMSQFYLTENIFYMSYWDWTEENGGSGYCYKTELGLTSIWDFFSDEESKKYYKQRLRYIISRWGYSNNIAILELMSEIDGVGIRYVPNEANQLVAHDCYYEIDLKNQGNEGACINDRESEIPEKNYVQNLVGEWSAEMATYLKSKFYEAPLVSANYAGDKGKQDSSFAAKDVDVMTRNNYSYDRFLDANYEYYSTQFYAADYDLNRNKTEYADLNKPFMFSESGPIPLYECCRGVEAVRSTWKLSFSGLAGAMDWVLIEDTSDYKSLGDLVHLHSNRSGEEWHAGAFKIIKGDKLKLHKRYIKKMQSKDSKADAICHRNEDGTKAYGVITNRTYNFYSQRDSSLDEIPFAEWNWESFCEGAVSAPITERQINKKPKEMLDEVSKGQFVLGEEFRKATLVNSEDSKVVIPGMTQGVYRITYYYYTNTHEPIYYSYDVGPNVKLEYPTLGNTENDFMIAFEMELLE